MQVMWTSCIELHSPLIRLHVETFHWYRRHYVQDSEIGDVSGLPGDFDYLMRRHRY